MSPAGSNVMTIHFSHEMHLVLLPYSCISCKVFTTMRVSWLLQLRIIQIERCSRIYTCKPNSLALGLFRINKFKASLFHWRVCNALLRNPNSTDPDESVSAQPTGSDWLCRWKWTRKQVPSCSWGHEQGHHLQQWSWWGTGGSCSALPCCPSWAPSVLCPPRGAPFLIRTKAL